MDRPASYAGSDRYGMKYNGSGKGRTIGTSKNCVGAG
jgi:hypothetical protein